MATFDLLGRRWMLRVLWELRTGPIGFRALQARCDDLSPTVLNTRLGELRAAGLVEQDHTRVHRLTRLGEDLLASLAPTEHLVPTLGRDDRNPRRLARHASTVRVIACRGRFPGSQAVHQE
jgi:DNA-binding HxlR family transcriptional regulator